MKNFKEEASGLLPNKSWREQRLYSQWQLGDTINLAIGQGYILATPLQLAVLAARFATGKEVMPYIEMNKTKQDFTEIDIDHAHLTIVQNAMFDAVNSRIGTAYTTNLPKDIRIAGKTGTPEINSQGKSHKLFIAYGSSHYAISVFIEYGKAPRQDFLIAYKILNHMALLDPASH
jgi:penicillin-binding protein 2